MAASSCSCKDLERPAEKGQGVDRREASQPPALKRRCRPFVSPEDFGTLIIEHAETEVDDLQEGDDEASQDTVKAKSETSSASPSQEDKSQEDHDGPTQHYSPPRITEKRLSIRQMSAPAPAPVELSDQCFRATVTTFFQTCICGPNRSFRCHS